MSRCQGNHCLSIWLVCVPIDMWDEDIKVNIVLVSDWCVCAYRPGGWRAQGARVTIVSLSGWCVCLYTWGMKRSRWCQSDNCLSVWLVYVPIDLGDEEVKVPEWPLSQCLVGVCAYRRGGMKRSRCQSDHCLTIWFLCTPIDLGDEEVKVPEWPLSWCLVDVCP